jgi:hypothetical protein
MVERNGAKSPSGSDDPVVVSCNELHRLGILIGSTPALAEYIQVRPVFSGPGEYVHIQQAGTFFFDEKRLARIKKEIGDREPMRGRHPFNTLKVVAALKFYHEKLAGSSSWEYSAYSRDLNRIVRELGKLVSYVPLLLITFNRERGSEPGSFNFSRGDGLGISYSINLDGRWMPKASPASVVLAALLQVVHIWQHACASPSSSERRSYHNKEYRDFCEGSLGIVIDRHGHLENVLPDGPFARFMKATTLTLVSRPLLDKAIPFDDNFIDLPAYRQEKKQSREIRFECQSCGASIWSSSDDILVKHLPCGALFEQRDFNSHARRKRRSQSEQKERWFYYKDVTHVFR